MTSADAPAVPSDPSGSAEFVSSPAVGPGSAFTAAEGATGAAHDPAAVSGGSGGSSSAEEGLPLAPAASGGGAAFSSSPEMSSERFAADGSGGGYTFAEADAQAAAAGDAAEAPEAADAAVETASQMELASPPVGVEEAAAGAAWGSDIAAPEADGSGAPDQTAPEVPIVPQATKMEAAAAAAVWQLQFDTAGPPKLPDTSISPGPDGGPDADLVIGGSAAGGAARSGGSAEAADTALLDRKRRQATQLRAKLRKTEAKAAGGSSKAQEAVVPLQEQVGPHPCGGGTCFIQLNSASYTHSLTRMACPLLVAKYCGFQSECKNIVFTKFYLLSMASFHSQSHLTFSDTQMCLALDNAPCPYPFAHPRRWRPPRRRRARWRRPWRCSRPPGWRRIPAPGQQRRWQQRAQRVRTPGRWSSGRRTTSGTGASGLAAWRPRRQQWCLVLG